MAKTPASRPVKGARSARAELLEAEVPERIAEVDIARVMRSNYQDYAAAVVVGRAIPDVRDGMKPVHRRILYTMSREGYDWNTAYRKSARIVGSVMGLYHPHGVGAARPHRRPWGAATAVNEAILAQRSLNE